MIGFYNELIDDKESLKECKIVFNDFEKLKNYIRKGDTVVTASNLSLFNIDSKELMILKDEFNLTIMPKETLNSNLKKSMIDFQFNVLLATMDFIKDDKNKLLKLLK